MIDDNIIDDIITEMNNEYNKFLFNSEFYKIITNTQDMFNKLLSMIPNGKQNIKELMLCVACQEKEKNNMFEKCKHVCICNTCKETLLNNKCPICRQESNIINIYL